MWKVGQNVATIGDKSIIKSMACNKNGIIKRLEENNILVQLKGNKFLTLIPYEGIARYVIRIYRSGKRDNTVFLSEYNNDKIILQRGSNTRMGILAQWRKLVKAYEGYTYCVKDMLQDKIIVGGILEPGDNIFIKRSIK